jgi:hypothetical protein
MGEAGRRSIDVEILATIGIVIASSLGFLTVGFLSGIAVLLAQLNLARANRASWPVQRRLAIAGVVVAWVGAGLGYWFWHWWLWDMHHSPGGGGPFQRPWPRISRSCRL